MSSPLQVRAKQIAQSFNIRRDDLLALTDQLVGELKQGLSRDGPTQMPSYIARVPAGSEHGTYLAVDLGGTNCRICYVHLEGNGQYTTKISQFAVPHDISVNAHYRPLFQFIAHNIEQFLEEHFGPQSHASSPISGLESQSNGAASAKSPVCVNASSVDDTDDKKSSTFPGSKANPWKLGFTFSFTFEQTSINRGTLIQWDKDWDIPEAIGRDPCAMLQEALDELSLAVEVSALVNDSVGALMARSYTHSKTGTSTLLAAIFGTGTNAAYVERQCNITRLSPGQQGPRDSVMIVNTEWGAFGGGPSNADNALPTTVYDDILDAASANQNEQLLEKRISGLYLGELLRLAVLDLLQDGLFTMVIDSDDAPVLHKGHVSSVLLSLLATCIEDDAKAEMNGAEPKLMARSHIATAFGICRVSPEDALAVETIATAIARRAAQLSAAALASIMIQSGRLDNNYPQPIMKALDSFNNSPNTCLSSSDSSETAKRHRVGENLKWVSPKSWAYAFISIYSSLKQLALHLQQCLCIRNNDATEDNIEEPIYHASSLARSSTQGNQDPAIVQVRDFIDIGVDGSLIEHHPHFISEIRSAWKEMPSIGPEGDSRIHIGYVRQGSLVGAALAAEAASTKEMYK